MKHWSLMPRDRPNFKKALELAQAQENADQGSQQLQQQQNPTAELTTQLFGKTQRLVW